MKIQSDQIFTIVRVEIQIRHTSYLIGWNIGDILSPCARFCKQLSTVHSLLNLWTRLSSQTFFLRLSRCGGAAESKQPATHPKLHPLIVPIYIAQQFRVKTITYFLTPNHGFVRDLQISHHQRLSPQTADICLGCVNNPSYIEVTYEQHYSGHAYCRC